MIPPKEIGNAYDQITHLWERDEFDRTNGIAQHQRAINFVKNIGLALDVGCGSTGRLIELMTQQGFEPHGIDISEKMLLLAKQKHPNVTFINDDICQWQAPNQYDFISAWDSIWHVPLTQQETLMIKLMSWLKAGGVFIFSAGGLDEPQQHTNNAMGVDVYYSTLGINQYLKVIAENGCVCRHVEYDQHPEQHVYFIVQKR